MPVGSGLSAQVGFATETTVGTIATPTKFVEFNSESLKLEKQIVQGAGLRGGGLVARASRRSYTTKTAGGDIELDVATQGMGVLFTHMLGTSTSALVSGSAYQQVHTVGQKTGKSFTTQKGVPQSDGTVKPFTYNGCKITEWELSCEVGGILTLSVTIDAWNETTATGLATASYPAAANVFHFAQGALVLGGTVSTASGVASLTGGTTVATVTSASVTGNSALKTDRFFFGSAGVKAEQIENGWSEFGGSLDAEFVNQATVYDLFAADTPTALRLQFVGTTAISGAVFPTLEVLIPRVYFDGDTPQVGGPDVVGFSAPFTALDDGTNTPLQIRYVTPDTAI